MNERQRAELERMRLERAAAAARLKVFEDGTGTHEGNRDTTPDTIAAIRKEIAELEKNIAAFEKD